MIVSFAVVHMIVWASGGCSCVLGLEALLVISGVSSLIFSHVLDLSRMIKAYWIWVGEDRRDCSEECDHGHAVVELHVDDAIAEFCGERMVS